MKKLILLFLPLYIVIIAAQLTAQPGLPDSPDQAPIDGGLAVLAVAGGAYALKKMKEDRT